MNVFVLCTGRCGSTTFIKACKHIKNYSSGHQSRCHLLGNARFSYKTDHIEADNRLSWLLGRLDKHYGDDAFYVHLTRDLIDVARSFSDRKFGIMEAYQKSGIIMGLRTDNQLKVAADYCDTVTSNIEFFLKEKNNKMIFKLENAVIDFPIFCKHISADVEMEKALNEFKILHNASN
jgi:hypothetical protein